MLRLRSRIYPKGAFAALRKNSNTSQLVGCALEIFVKQGLFQVHVPGINQATPVLFCHQVRLYSLEERSSPTLDVWAARVGGDTETGRAHSGSGPQTSARASPVPGRKPG